MSLLKSNAVQIGQSLTATNNFTLYQPSVADGTVRLGVGNAGSVTDAVTVTSAGNVGVGTSTPTGKLDLFANVNAGSISTLTFSANNAASAKKDYVQFVPSIEFNTTSSEAGGYTLKVLQQGAYKNSIVASGITNNSSNYLAFSTTNEAMRITNNGNVGIGTSSPSNRLEVVKSDPSSLGAIARFYHGPSSNRSIEFGTSSVSPFPLYIQGRSTGSATNEMALQPEGGALFVGTNGSVAGSGYIFNPSGFLQHARPLGAAQSMTAFYNGGNIVGEIRTSTTATSYITSSDYRLKENVAPMTGALAVVQALKPVTYTWKSNGEESQGFIAHELQAVAPDCVTGEKDEVDEDGKPVYQGIDTSFLVATLTAAIQELKSELDSVKAEVQTLKGN